MYPAKQTVNKFQHPILAENIEEVHVLSPPVPFSFIESSVCPFCHGLEFSEFVEPQPEIVSVKSVPIEDADALIKDGYVVLEVYAKTVNLIKKAEKSSLKERQENIDKDAATLRKELDSFLKEE
jgi:hypothetical protein